MAVLDTGGWGWVDAVLSGILLLSVLVGWVRGFVFEVMSLLGWLVAYFAALWFSSALAPHLPVGSPGSAMNHLVAFACTFVLALIAWMLIARGIRLLIRATPLSLPDRFLGSLFGLARGLVLLLTLATVVAFTPWRHSTPWQASRLAGVLNDAMAWVRPWLPEDISRYLSVASATESALPAACLQACLNQG